MAKSIRELAELEANTFPPGAMSADDILGVWQRHPDFAPGGVYYEPVEAEPEPERVGFWDRLLRIFG